MSVLRRYLAFLCVLGVLLVPAVGLPSTGGDGGLVNLPGGGSRTAKSKTQSASENLVMVLPPHMWGAVAFVTSHPTGGLVVLPTGACGMFTLESWVIQALMQAGARRLQIQFVVLGAQLTVEISLDPENNTVTVYGVAP